MTLLSLPLELLIRTFTHLSISSIHALSCTNKFLRNAIAESIELRALEKCIRHSAEFHPASCLSLDENLRYLEVTESRWASGVPRCAVNVPLPGKVSGIYDLCGGNYVLGDSTRRTLYSLSTRHPGLPEWKRIDVNREVVDLGLSIYEHDLVAYVTLDRQGPKTNLILFFAEYSTGLPHPQARESTVLVETYTPHDAVPFRAPSVGIEIVGEYLVLLVLNNDTGNPLAPGGPMDTFCVLEWKTGKEMLRSSFSRKYWSPLIVSPHLIAFVNTTNNTPTLDFFPLTPAYFESVKDSSPRPALGLALPPLMPGCRVMYSSARCEPNPSSIYPATKDVFNSAEVVMTHWKDAVATIYIHLLPFPHLDMPISFALYVHRTSLLHLFDSWFPSSIWLPEPDAEEERFLAEVDDSSNLDDDEELDLPGTFRENAKIPSSTLLNGDAAASVRARPIMLIPWELWGPRYARMLNCTSDLADINTDWITTSCGHRVVRYSPNGFREATQQPPRVREPIYGDVEEEDAESIQPTEPSEIDPDENVQMSADTAEDAMWPTESDSSQETDEPDTQAPVLDGVHELIHRFQLLQQSLETQVIASQQTDGAQSAGAGSSSSIPNATTLSAYQQTLNTRIQALQDLIHRLEGAAAAREQSGSGNDTLESEEDSENRPVGHTIEVLTFPPPCLGTVDVDEPRRIMMHSPDAEMYDPQHCWAQRVISNLPYQTVKVNWEGVLVIEKEVDGKGKGKAINHDETEDSDYDGVLMDEENLILVRSRSNHDDNDATRLAVRILKFDGREIS